MELVYLWIRNYKNIKQLGCSLNADYEEFSNSYDVDNDFLSISLKQQGYLNVFGEHLNIKTIIGTNGSGKSNLCQALVSILRTNYEKDIDDYFEKTLPEKYYLLYKINDKYQCFTNCKNTEILINNELLQMEKKDANECCALFKPFLNKEEDFVLEFPKNRYMKDIIKKKMENYFYYDRFRMYDTSHALRGLFHTNKELGFKIFDGSNQYLTFDMYGYEINILQEFEWLTYQINNNIPSRIKKANTTFQSIWELVDRLQRLNEGIIEKAKKQEYKDKDIVAHEVLSNGCFEFVLLKMAEMFYYLEGQENIISLKNLEMLLSYGETLDYKTKHTKFKEFYEEILFKFNKEIQDEQIKVQLERYNFNEYFINLLNSCIFLESQLLDNKTFFQDILTTDDGNTYRPVLECMIDVEDDNLTEAMSILNTLGIFKQNFYNHRNNKLYTFNDLSTGEQRILRFFADILSIKNNEATKDTDIFIFDEMDVSWHPEWQRKMVDYVVDFFKKTNNEKIDNIIFTTHSPLILSDMPRNNVIMLQRDNNGNPKIVSSIENTFCANIHDLFNNSFFLGDCDGICTVGEFAKHYIENFSTKINNVSNESDFKSMQQEIDIIGEPIIKNYLLKKIIKVYQKYNDIPTKYQELIQKYNKLKERLNEKDQH